MSDSLRVCLIIVLLLSVFITPGLSIFEGFLHGYAFTGILTTFMLLITQIILIIVLCSTKNVKTLIIFVIIITVFILISFIIKIIILSNFIENGRQMFYQLMKEHPGGERPNNVSLILYYMAIKEQRCCGIDTNSPSSPTELLYFYSNFPRNCLSIRLFSRDPQDIYRGQPCMNVVHHLHHLVIGINIIQIFFISMILILLWIYILLRRQKQKRIAEQTMIYPLNTTVYNPYVVTLPTYQETDKRI